MKLQEAKRRTIDEEIARCLETAEKYKIASEGQDISELTRKGCQEVAMEQQQLAEWLTELKELKPLKGIQQQIMDFKKSVKSENSDYLTGYLSALSAVEGMIDEAMKR